MLLVLLFCLNIVYSQPVKSDYNIGYTTVKENYSSFHSTITDEFNSGRPQVRRVRGYTENGDPVGDDAPNNGGFWDYDNYDYYWDGQNWWRKYKGNNGRNSWQIYNSTLGNWHWSILEHLWKNHPDPSVTPKGYEENPLPIGDPITLLYLLSIYVVYERINNKRKHARKLGETDVLDYGLNVTI